MWRYIQRTGQMLHPDGTLAGTGYSGFGVGRNEPDLAHVQDVGPIPTGVYRIGSPFDSLVHGPVCLPLTPDAANQMSGRSGFLIHGDSGSHPGEASRGCIILDRMTRLRITGSADRGLDVVADVPQADPIPVAPSPDIG